MDIAEATKENPNPSVHHISVFTEMEAGKEVSVTDLSLEEKVGQMIFAGIKGTSLPRKQRKLFQLIKSAVLSCLRTI